MVDLTIGIPTYDDFDGVYFTVQALHLYQDLRDVEIVVVDNYGCEHTKTFMEGWARGKYVRATEAVGTAAAKNIVFREARGEAVLCCDSHVLFGPGVIARLKDYYRAHPDSIDLLQGPLLYDDAQGIATHFEPVWRGQMWGIWATDPRGTDPEGEPFPIPMQGMGAFSCRASAWPGFNPAFRGFGAEEGYIHEKIRQAGGQCLCLPWFRWMHRFGRPSGVPYPLVIEDKLRNYIIGHAELGLDITPVLTHFAGHLPEQHVVTIAAEALWGSAAVPSLTSADEGDADRNSTLPLVSGICATYGRPPKHQHLLEEAIESFLRQTYPNKELIVLNDCPEQELVCDAPGVRVVNTPERFPTLGEKLNAAVGLARGELIALWDDDDISLPWRLSLSVERLSDADYFNPRCYWFEDCSGLHVDHPVGYAHMASLFTRSAFQAVGGYPAISFGCDAEMDGALSQRERVVDPQRRGSPALTRDEWFYIYRWGVSAAHVSSRADEDVYREIGTRPVQRGRFLLHPHWRTDYEAATRQLVQPE